MDSSILELAAAFRLSLSRLNRRLRLEAREPGLSVAKHTVLALLDREGPKTPGALAEAEGVQPQSLTRVFAELEDSGLVLRKRDKADRRQFLLEITSEGRKLIFRDAENRALWLASAINLRLNVIEQEMLRVSHALMQKLYETPAADLQELTSSPPSTEGRR
jgi:DNA-binding MarR family transcriptional regulator